MLLIPCTQPLLRRRCDLAICTLSAFSKYKSHYFSALIYINAKSQKIARDIQAVTNDWQGLFLNNVRPLSQYRCGLVRLFVAAKSCFSVMRWQCLAACRACTTTKSRGGVPPTFEW